MSRQVPPPIPPHHLSSPQSVACYQHRLDPFTMTKSKAAKRKREAQASTSQKVPKTVAGIVTPPPDDTAAWEPKTLHTLVDDDELETTIETLATLARHPGLIKSKACKDLRTAVYDFKQACTTGVNTAGQQETGRETSRQPLICHSRREPHSTDHCRTHGWQIHRCAYSPRGDAHTGRIPKAGRAVQMGS